MVKQKKISKEKVEEWLATLTSLSREYGIWIDGGCGCCGGGVFSEDHEDLGLLRGAWQDYSLDRPY